VGKPPCGAEPRIELGPALQQADALPTEPRRTISEPRRTMTEPRRTITEPRRTMTEPRRTMPKLNNAVLVCSSFGGLRGLRACEGPLRLFVAVPMTISRPWLTSAAGVSFAESSDLCRNRR
jgi:hypothetical protein